MKKFCVFCGERPIGKNLEHIIPQWLIKMTGDTKRNISLGIDLSSDEPGPRSFPFDQFKFPACTECNDTFSKLESQTAHILPRILMNQSISDSEIDVFLDWLDKVRVGLWLAFFYLDKNFFEITPNFHITKRLGKEDRLLYIYKSKSAPRGVNFIGQNSPAFYFSPSCFLLRVNDHFFFNSSFQFLCSKGLGFPYPKTMEYAPEGLFSISLKGGTGRLKLPVNNYPSLGSCVEIFQANFGNETLKAHENHLFSIPYVKENSLDYSKCKGKVFIEKNNQLIHFPKSSGDGWAVTEERDFNFLIKKLFVQTYDFQTKLLMRISAESLDKNDRIGIRKLVNQTIAFNKMMIERENEIEDWNYEK